MAHSPVPHSLTATANASVQPAPACLLPGREPAGPPQKNALGQRLKLVVAKTVWLYEKGSKQVRGLVALGFKKNKKLFFKITFYKMNPHSEIELFQ